MDKIDRLLEAIAHPDQYADTEIEEMLRDPEVREVFELLDTTKASCQPISEPDVEEEWTKFKTANPASPQKQPVWSLWLRSRKAVACIAIGVVAVAAVGAFIGLDPKDTLQPQSENNLTTAVQPTALTGTQEIAAKVAPKEIAAPETVVFDNDPMETIIRRIADYYGCGVHFESDRSKNLRLYFRWNQALPIEDVVESLNNFEQIHLTLNDRTIIID